MVHSDICKRVSSTNIWVSPVPSRPPDITSRFNYPPPRSACQHKNTVHGSSAGDGIFVQSQIFFFFIEPQDTIENITILIIVQSQNGPFPVCGLVQIHTVGW